MPQNVSREVNRTYLAPPFGLEKKTPMMMKHTVWHGLGRESALDMTRVAFAHYREKHTRLNPIASWSQDRVEVSFSARGWKLGGEMLFDDEDILVRVEVPFLFRPLWSRAVGVLERELTRWVEHTRRHQACPPQGTLG